MRRHREPVDRRSLAEQWSATIGALLALQTRYVDWHEAVPEGLRDTPTGEALQAIADLETWVRMGAPDPRTENTVASVQAKSAIDWNKAREWWSFRPLNAPQPPQVKYRGEGD